MNIEPIMLNKMLAKRIQAYIKNINHNDHVGFITEMQDWFKIHTPVNVINNISVLEDKNCMTISIDAGKTL